MQYEYICQNCPQKISLVIDECDMQPGHYVVYFMWHITKYTSHVACTYVHTISMILYSLCLTALCSNSYKGRKGVSVKISDTDVVKIQKYTQTI